MQLGQHVHFGRYSLDAGGILCDTDGRRVNMSDPIIPGSLEDVNPRDQSALTLDNFGPNSALEPPVKHEVCVVCGFIYRRDEMVRYQQQWYCKPNECSRDIAGKELNAHPNDHFKDKSLAARFYKGSGGATR